MRFDRNTKILIIGLGLIGGSYAAALSEKGFSVGAVEKRQSAIDFALEKGWITRGVTVPDPAFLSEYDLLVFALYPHDVVRFAEENQSYFKKGALLTDVTGVKCGVVDAVQAILRPDLEFIGAHPMAGREVSGVENADPALFRGANFIITPTEKNSEEAVETCRELGAFLGCGRISCLTPAAHDEMVGFLSQLTHCIAVCLMDCKNAEHLADYTGDSFRDLTRIAKINDGMWSELFLLNKKELLAGMDRFADTFAALRGYIEAGDVAAIRQMMRLSTERRRYFDEHR